MASQRRVEQLPKEAHHEVVLIRAPVDLEGRVEDGVHALRDELGPREVGFVDEMAGGFGLIVEPGERNASRRGLDHAARDAQRVHLVAVEQRWVSDGALGEDHVDERDVRVGDVRGRVRAVRSASDRDSLHARRGIDHSSLVVEAAMPGAHWVLCGEKRVRISRSSGAGITVLVE